MENLKEQTDRSVEEYQEQWALFQPDQTGYSIGQYDATASLDPFSYDGLTSFVWGDDTEQPPGNQYAFEEQPDPLSLGTAYPSNYPDQREYDFNTFQPGSVPTGFDPAQELTAWDSSLNYPQPLIPPDGYFDNPESVGPEFHRIVESSDSPGPKPKGKSKSSQHDTPRSKLINRSTQFLVKREDEESFNYNGKPEKDVKVQGLTQVGYICNCTHTKLKKALPDIEPGKAASVTTKSGTWVIKTVDS
jgi:hypothetical protein